YITCTHRPDINESGINQYRVGARHAQSSTLNRGICIAVPRHQLIWNQSIRGRGTARSILNLKPIYLYCRAPTLPVRIAPTSMNLES
ncbi:hypothetical protein, partial [Microseira wollei]|uniref:hypothetical protein n=1 Tax=Microseira wollei TaxID=467598 RepID=UPI001CFDB254